MASGLAKGQRVKGKVARGDCGAAWVMRVGRVGALVALALGVAACQQLPRRQAAADGLPLHAACPRGQEAPGSPEDEAAVQRLPGGPKMAQAVLPGWSEKRLPGKRWRPFLPVMVEGQLGLQVCSDASLSLLRKRLEPPRLGPAELRFSWWVEQLLPDADPSDSQASDAPVQVLVAFDGDRSALSGRFAILSEMVQLITGDPLPFASLIYVWTTRADQPVGTVIPDPRTDRIRYLVVEQGETHLRRWVHHRRDVHADFRRVFGEEPGPMVGLAVMSDSDNTRGRTRAIFGPVALVDASSTALTQP